MRFVVFLAVIGFVGYFFAYPKIRRIVLMKIFPVEYSESVERYAAEYGIDENLIYTFIRVESDFDSDAVSDVGAIGLTQITEETFAWIKSKIAADEEIAYTDLYNPDLSVRFGAYYIQRCLERYGGDISTRAAAYHSGWGTVDSLLEEDNTEILTEFPYTNMANYVYKINRVYSFYKEIYSTEGE